MNEKKAIKSWKALASLILSFYNSTIDSLLLLEILWEVLKFKNSKKILFYLKNPAAQVLLVCLNVM